MLLEYFCLEIKVSIKKDSIYTYNYVSANKDGLIYSLPALLDNYTPNLDRLPHFLLCLAVEVHNRYYVSQCIIYLLVVG